MWLVITKMFPGQFPKDYPPSSAVLKTALEKFKSKQEVEKEWINMNVLPFQRMLLVKLEESVGRIMPTVLITIVLSMQLDTHGLTFQMHSEEVVTSSSNRSTQF